MYNNTENNAGKKAKILHKMIDKIKNEKCSNQELTAFKIVDIFMLRLDEVTVALHKVLAAKGNQLQR